MRLIATSLLLVLALAGCEQRTLTIAGPNFRALHDWVSTTEQPGLALAGLNRSYQVGDEIELSVTSEAEGRLYLLQVDAADDAAVFFPNAEEDRNVIRTGEVFSVPPQGAEWSMLADAPLGDTLIVALVVPNGTKLDEVVSVTSSAGVQVGSVSAAGAASMVVSIGPAAAP